MCQTICVHCWNIIRNSWRIKPLWKFVLNIVLTGVVVPTFADFSYYFLTNEIGFSQFTYSILSLLSNATLLVGVLVYKVWLTNYEVRTLIMISICISIFGCFTSLLLVLRLNLKMGISDLLFVIMTDTITGVVYMAFTHLP